MKAPDLKNPTTLVVGVCQKLFVSWNEREISSGSDRSRQEAEQRLADWVETKDDRWGYVFSRPRGKVLLVLSGKDA